MTEVRLHNRRAEVVLGIVRELRAQGLVQGIDFDFSYHQAQDDMFSMSPPTPSYAIFKFYVEKYATFFAIKYAK
jgi:hypothetical protein